MCVSLVCIYILKKDLDSVLGIFFFDYFIFKIDKFESVIKKGYEIVKKGYIVCFGIVLIRVDINYGYIKFGREFEKGVFIVEWFVEKFDVKRVRYLVKLKYFWNSGIYIFKIFVFLKELKRYMFYCYDIFMRIFFLIFIESYIDELKKGYKFLDKILVDKVIMEKIKRFVVLIVDFEWDDVGSWFVFERILIKDENVNVIKVEVIIYEMKNCIIFLNKFVIVFGIKDIIFILVDDVIFVCYKLKEREIKEII